MLEKVLGDPRRGVYVREKLLNSEVMRHIRADNYDYSVATKTCCENVIGYLQMPLGQIGPLSVDDVEVRPILATTGNGFTRDNDFAGRLLKYLLETVH